MGVGRLTRRTSTSSCSFYNFRAKILIISSQKLEAERSLGLQLNFGKAHLKAKLRLKTRVWLLKYIKAVGRSWVTTQKLVFASGKQQQTCETFSRSGLKLNWLVWEQRQQVSCFLLLGGHEGVQLGFPGG